MMVTVIPSCTWKCEKQTTFHDKYSLCIRYSLHHATAEIWSHSISSSPPATTQWRSFQKIKNMSPGFRLCTFLAEGGLPLFLWIFINSPNYPQGTRLFNLFRTGIFVTAALHCYSTVYFADWRARMSSFQLKNKSTLRKNLSFIDVCILNGIQNSSMQHDAWP